MTYVAVIKYHGINISFFIFLHLNTFFECFAMNS